MGAIKAYNLLYFCPTVGCGGKAIVSREEGVTMNQKESATKEGKFLAS